MKTKHYKEAIVDLFMLVRDEPTRRKLFDLLSCLEDEYRAVLAVELRKFLLTGRDSLWLKSRLLLRFYCIAKRMLGYPADEANFNLTMYHYFEQYKDSII